MDTIIYFTITIAFLILFSWGVTLANRHGWMSLENVILLVMLALFYDNGIQGLGKYIGEGELLESLNLARYWLHALITPLLALFGWRSLVNANIKWAKTKIVKWGAILLTLSLIIYNLLAEVWGISIQSAWNNGVLSYKVVSDEESLPIMIIGVSAILFITSIIVWVKQKWPWYFFGILFMSITPIIDSWIQSDTFHNVGEFVLLLSLLATKNFQYHTNKKTTRTRTL